MESFWPAGEVPAVSRTEVLLLARQDTPAGKRSKSVDQRYGLSLLAHARKQEISLPVACLLVLMRSASQLFKLHTRRSLYDGLKRLQKRFSISLGEGPRLLQECFLSHLAD